MAYANYFYILAILASFNLTLAQEGSGNAELTSGPINAPEVYEGPHEGKNERQSLSFGQIPFFSGFSSIPGFESFLSSFPSFGSNSQSGSIPSSGSFPNLGSGLGSGFPFFGSNGASNAASSFDGARAMSASRDDDDYNHDGNEDDEDSDAHGPHNRLFFSTLFNTRLTTCNYTTQAGSTCSSCRQVLTCFRSNVGKLKTCKFFPYCNNGRCSLFPGAACSSATTTTTTTAATTNAVTTDATTVTTT